jgi:hypothetical protein
MAQQGLSRQARLELRGDLAGSWAMSRGRREARQMSVERLI